MQLPDEFLKAMKSLLPGEEYEALERAYGQPAFHGVRVNLLKCSAEYFKEQVSFPLRPAPFAPEGFYCELAKPGRHPWHHAGVFYSQEPSALSAVTALGPRPGDRVLDLCAAPGGKSTQIAGRLGGRGLLVSNEVVYSRAKILVSNLERSGVRNAVVTCSPAQLLCERFAGYFDGVLVDAPCSGEGMFRRDPAALREWTPQSPAACAKRQLALLKTASGALRENGVLVYSTCTFSPLEDEGVVERFLAEDSGFALEAMEAVFGRPAIPGPGMRPDLALARRIFPMDGGEGHFVARLRKRSASQLPAAGRFGPQCGREEGALLKDFFQSQFSEPLWGAPHGIEDGIFLLPEEMPDFSGLRVLRAGVPAGRVVPGRVGSHFEPAHGLYLAADARQCRRRVDFDVEAPELACFLHGDQLEAPEGLPNGYAAVLAGGFPVGFGKISAGVLKNHYPKGLRNF